MSLLFLDVHKAFDSHNVLLTKIKTLGFSANVLDWFCSYLNRTRRVRFSGKDSNEVDFIGGIPQGSCLGLTLFIFYINEIFLI